MAATSAPVSLVDYRVFGKFAGAENDWQQWSFVFVAYAHRLDPDMGREMERAGRQPDPVNIDGMTEAASRRAAVLYNILVMLWLKLALMFLQLIESGRRGARSNRS